ncbi:sugar-binding domain-containing protein [Geofilum rubicundum]|uniref:Beta-galactosidase n=1 Tax=Geofilum rubicundum JCM 15548 TaxID=1236989 RepID=A0A0E9LT75_9BACT|nr:sugar-binding domain-containing protein [Geofilum rubicundum]GAO28356.1 beta-galactosidase [Geofilum rubicundum JCM 15548]
MGQRVDKVKRNKGVWYLAPGVKSHLFRLNLWGILFSVLSMASSCSSDVRQIDLSGNWGFALDSTDVGVSDKWFENELSGSVKLPGTLDDAGIGTPNTLMPKLEKPQVLRLTRKHSYTGPVWYQKKVLIPENWKGKNISLKLGRVIWESRVWINDQPVGSQESLIAPHYYDLSQVLTPGEHLITIRIDNRKKHSISVREMAHAYTNETQIIWNGVIGDLNLTASDPVFVSNIQVYPDVDNQNCRVVCQVSNQTSQEVRGVLNIWSQLKGGSDALSSLNREVSLAPGQQMVEFIYPMGDDIKLWDEFNPNLYVMHASIEGDGFADQHTTTFGMRQITNNDAKFQINGRRLFLRGTLECNIFPLTGHPPMDKAGWEKVFTTAREWGLNHLRFHSWCPPKAAFEVADEMGFYLQPELPVWTLDIGEDMPTVAFLKDEADRMIREYGNHPSFSFWCLGNELQGDFEILESILLDLKDRDKRHLYATTAYTFQEGHGKWPEPHDDYFTTQITKKGWVRGQGLFDTEYPSFDKKYTSSIEGLPVPLVTHEIGQYAVFPNLREIDKYTGVLEPLNFKAVREDMQQKGLLDRADDYLKATGKFAAILYKEEIERAIKSDGLSGYQLLDLHDFPGQGTALVGLLDAFWENKGVISSEEYRQFSAPVVPFANFPKAVYLNNEEFSAVLAVSNYSDTILPGGEISWELTSTMSDFRESGIVKAPEINIGANSDLGTISAKLNEINKAEKLNLEVTVGDYANSWDVWVYPAELNTVMGDVLYTRDLSEASKALDEGRKVLFNPDFNKINGLEGKFVPVFWSPVHFPNQAGTMGLLCDPTHAAFNDFPTDAHSNWQWWDLCKQSRVVSIDSIPGADPILINIDNFNRNSSLSSIFETKVGTGKLLFCTMDLSTDMSNRPVARQLLHSLLNYVKGESFHPSGDASINEIVSLISRSESDINNGSIYD